MLHELDGWDSGNSWADRNMVHVVHIDKLAETVGADDPAGELLPPSLLWPPSLSGGGIAGLDASRVSALCPGSCALVLSGSVLATLWHAYALRLASWFTAADVARMRGGLKAAAARLEAAALASA